MVSPAIAIAVLCLNDSSEVPVTAGEQPVHHFLCATFCLTVVGTQRCTSNVLDVLPPRVDDPLISVLNETAQDPKRFLWVPNRSMREAAGR